MLILDANIILRYLLNDNAALADKATEYVDRADAFVTIEVIAEVVYVLKGVYSLDRPKIRDILKAFLELVKCKHRNIIFTALDLYGDRNLDFVDCVLYAYHKVENAEIATFDLKFQKAITHTN